MRQRENGWVLVMIDSLLYWAARAVIAFLQALPLRWVARLGRCGGQLAYWLDARHRRVAISNLTAAFGTELPPREIQALARENFRRIGENYASAVKTFSMSNAELFNHMELVGLEKLPQGAGTHGLVMVIGHFGNFELYARVGLTVNGYQPATTYRGLRQPALDRLLQDLRAKTGCRYFERRRDAAALKLAMSTECVMLGLLADQHAGDKGLRLPFLGRDCSTSAAPVVLAQRYECPVYTSICYRVGLARWRVEVGNDIPLWQDGKARSPEEVMLEVNQTFERAIRKDPANWFWVHNRWKPVRRPAVTASVPASEDVPEP